MQTSFSTLSFATFYQSNKQLLASPSRRGQQQHQQPPLDRRALFYMFLLALQFGVQPILTRRYTPPGITRSTVVLMQEFVKFAIAGSMLQLSGKTGEALEGWSVRSWLSVAFVPAALYSVQNLMSLLAYQNLDALTYNVLNQTKTLSAALCCYLVMGRTQSVTQIAALLLLLVSALVMEGILPIDRALSFLGRSDDFNLEKEERERSQWESRHWTHGVVPVLAASFISGLAGALSQKNLQSSSNSRNAYFFSMELCLGSVMLLSTSLLFVQDGRQIAESGFWHQWTPLTFIPIFTNSVGGIIVGLVTKYAGSVRKGFALIFGILLSGIIQARVESDRIPAAHVAGGLLAALSLYLHSANPPLPSLLPSRAAKKKEE